MKQIIKRILAGIGGFAWAMASPAFASVLTVPGQYATIQSALNAASDGDEIVVSPGVYTENLGMHKAVLLRSTFDGFNWDAVTSTTIKAASNSAEVIAANASGKTMTIRGFHITRDQVTTPTLFAVFARGITGNGTTKAIIEYNIIENQVCIDPIHHSGEGAGISSLNDAIIRNNIIRNNRANSDGAIDGCANSIIQNNVIYNNTGGAVGSCSGAFVNNTVYDAEGIGLITGQIVNNILWGPDSMHVPAISASSTPSFCIIKNYTGPGANIITSTPRFINATNGDFHLQSNSPAIDAGITATTTSKSDINGVQRGLKGVQSFRGDGSAIDIGAYEFLPQPIAVWFHGGAPDAIRPGDTLPVAWQLTANAGSQINLQLFRDQSPRTDFGLRNSIPGPEADTFTGKTTITLSAALPFSGGYSIKGTSAALPNLIGQTPFFTILGLSAVASDLWGGYR